MVAAAAAIAAAAAAAAGAPLLACRVIDNLGRAAGVAWDAPSPAAQGAAHVAADSTGARSDCRWRLGG